MSSDGKKTIQNNQDVKEHWLARNPLLVGLGPLMMFFILNAIIVLLTNEPWLIKNMFWIRPFFGLSGIAAALWVLVFGSLTTFVGVKKGNVRVRL